MSTNKQDQFIESAPEFAQPFVDLWHWSFNFSGFAPFNMLLDLVGFSAEEYGENLHNWNTDADALGWYELNLLAAALAAWSSRPTDSADWVRGLCFTEQEDSAE